MGVREAQKLATRRRVLDAASDLFNEIGFEDATVRAIANRAGVSVGSVFTTFTSKADILNQVMQDRLEQLYEETGRVIPLMRGSTADRCRSLFAVLYAFETRRVKLFLAHIAVAYRWDMEPTARPFGANQVFRDLMGQWLAEGIGRGDVRPDADIGAIVDLLLGLYAWNYRLAASEGADADRLTALMDQQVGTVFEGLRPRG
ncbi:TetR/AcrR family transcriptional regulator [Caulobacter sp. KR2-114]|uniref:TetR/AcrR family transcriptional regulator n=1 Tax=Caulobacter sp. KR2-114 TaxID=3400912 RepID=UPI003C05CBDE